MLVMVEKEKSSLVNDTEIEVPQDREGTFEPQIVKKRQKDISDIEDKIISMYAIGKGIMMLFMEQKLFL